MTNLITANEFHQTEGVDDWRVVDGEPAAFFRTGSYAAGLSLVAAIGEVLGDAAPRIDLRAEGVLVRLADRDVDLAIRVSEAALAVGAPADTTVPRGMEVAIDTVDHTAIAPFWCAVLGYEVNDPDGDAIADPYGVCPPFWFQKTDEPRTQRGRFHIDVSVPHDLAEARVAAAIAAGGRLVTDRFAPAWWILADADGNEACVCTWMGRTAEGMWAGA